MARKFWWPGAMPDQLVLIQNFRTKIGSYATTLGLTPADLTAATNICDTFINAFNATEQCRMSMFAMTQWRDAIFDGVPVGKDAPDAPVFPVVTVANATLGIIKQFFSLRDRIIASTGYSQTIGDDLGIVGAEITPRPVAEIAPELKTATSAGFQVNVTGSMQGMDALRVEYAPKGGNFTAVAFLTNTPGGFQITPANPNQPENGHIRAVFIKKNAIFGNYSADYPVTLS